tara:strand:+ start:5016 stop:5363 length:348 start_codon:yes stop_codon:yes gene_type:complete
MSLVWPNKDPDELLDYSIDWSDIAAGFTISTVTWSVRSNVNPAETVLAAGQNLTTATNSVIIDSIQNIQQALSGKIAILYVGGGVDRRDYTFVCTITTSISTTIQRAVILRCRSV